MPDYNEMVSGYMELLILYGSAVIGVAFVYMCIITVIGMVKRGE